ncbi:MAG TPA: dihydropteroate synthase [Candidatus Binatia bacterium]|nr:dihydropteroate synthase [Candidatus Binatia bacterium]
MTELVGILNVTPDSFSDGGQFNKPLKAIARAKQLLADGASFIDVGAESTRPNASTLTPAEEWQRLEPVLTALIAFYPGKISLDSYHPETIYKAFKIGPVIVNDVIGMNNPAIVELVAKLKPTVIISQLPGSDIQAAHRLMPVTSPEQVKTDLLAKAKLLESHGLTRAQIILDPGIGFGKTPEVNRLLLGFAELVPDYNVMIGYSRKRFLGEQRMELAPNLAAARLAIMAGARYLRVHDVAGHKAALSKLLA